MRNTFIDTILSVISKRKDIFIISGDAGLGVFDEFKEQFPDQFLNMGVAEQNMTSFAAGLALTGYKVFIYNIIPFVLYRNYEQVRNDICYQKLPVTLVGIGSGITYAPQGMTHYSVEDIGIARTLPNLSVISPIDPVEAKLAAEYSLNAKGPVYVRLAKRGEPNIHKTENFDITSPQVIAEGEDVAILFHGSISKEVMEAYERLTNDSYYPMLVSVPMIQPLDSHCLLEKLKGIKAVVSIEEHFVNSGLGSVLKDLQEEKKSEWQLKALGIPYGYIHAIKDTENMRKLLAISSADIVKTVTQLIQTGV